VRRSCAAPRRRGRCRPICPKQSSTCRLHGTIRWFGRIDRLLGRKNDGRLWRRVGEGRDLASGFSRLGFRFLLYRRIATARAMPTVRFTSRGAPRSVLEGQCRIFFEGDVIRDFFVQQARGAPCGCGGARMNERGRVVGPGEVRRGGEDGGTYGRTPGSTE